MHMREIIPVGCFVGGLLMGLSLAPSHPPPQPSLRATEVASRPARAAEVQQSVAAAAGAAADPDTEAPLLPIPESTQYVYINIGTSWDPWPGCGAGDKIKAGHAHTGGMQHDPRVFCIYVEPLLRVNNALRDRGVVTNTSLLIHAAVGGFSGVAPFYEYAGKNGVASSLSKTAKQDTSGPFRPEAQGLSITTVITLKHLLAAIPRKFRILQLKTDMQAHDFKALKSAGPELLRVDELWNECADGGYENEENSFEAMEPYLTKLGFQPGKHRSHDCNWRRIDANGKPPERVPGLPYLGLF